MLLRLRSKEPPLSQAISCVLRLPRLQAVGGHTCRFLLKPEIRIFLDINQKVVITLEVFGEAVIVAGVFAGLGAVFPTHIGPVFVDGTFIVRH